MATPNVPEAWVGGSTFAETFGLRANLFTAYQSFAARVWETESPGPSVLEACRLRTADVLGVGDGSSRAASGPCIDFAEQFVIDPAGIGRAGARAVKEACGFEGLIALVNAMAAFDGFTRFAMVLGCGLPGGGDSAADIPSPSGPTASAGEAVANSPLASQPALLAAFERLYAVLWSEGVVDHPSKEVARLRNARVTNCAYCRSVRFSQARADGLTEDLVDLIADGFEASALTERHKAVIRLANAFLRDPLGGVEPPLRADLLGAYGPAGVVELTAGLALFMGFSKITVALGGPTDELPVQVVETPALS